MAPMKRILPACLVSLALFTGARADEAVPRSTVLSDGWLFQPDPLRVGDAGGWYRPGFDRSAWRRVAVPMAWDRYDPVMDGYEGVGWYALPLPAGLVSAGAWQRLRFHRAHHHATVWIDGNLAGESSIGYLPFDVDVTPWLPPGRPAWIVVRVENGARYDWLPGTTTVEWVQYGGLLEPVELLTTPPAFIEALSLRGRPLGDGDGELIAAIELRNSSGSSFAGRVRLEAGGRAVEMPAEVKPRAARRVILRLPLAGLAHWDPGSPALHEATARLLDGPRGLDALSDRFGVRSIEARGRDILLNGRPVRVRGVNRYDEFPGRGPVVDEAVVRADLEAVKAAGANLVRTHFPQAPVNLRLADELGLLVMEEVPLNWWRAPWHPPVPKEFRNDRIIDAAEEALERMIRRDGSHPSVVIWSMANECETSDSMGIRAMERLLRRARALDDTRLLTYVANRAFEKNRAFALADLVAANLYYGMWDGPVAEDLSQIEERVHAPTRDALAAIARAFPDKPILLSEFGTIGIPGSGGDVRFSEDYQAAYLTAVWQAVEEVPEVAGGVVWSWADYRHRNGFLNDFPTFYGPFGLVTFDRHPKKARDALSRRWAAAPESAAVE